MKNTILLLGFLCTAMFSQTASLSIDPRLNRLEIIYRNLEYNTTSFNDLKQTWIVTDPVFVREIFNKFVVNNALKLAGRKPTVAEIENKAESIYNGDVFIDLRRRFYDEEIEMIRFFKEQRNAVDTSDYFFDAVYDFVSVKDILGEKLYADLKSQAYSLNDITKTYFDYKPAYNFNILLHLLEPDVMFWSATTNNRNKYLVSLMGRWGADRIGLPGWYSADYIMGIHVAYQDSLVNNKAEITYSAEFGVGVPVAQPDLGVQDKFVGRKLEHTGTPIYMKFTGKPFESVLDEIADLEAQVTAQFTIGTKKVADFNVSTPITLFSTRNYFDVMFKKNNITRLSDFGNFSAGVGFSAFDIKQYVADPTAVALSLIEGTGVNKNGYKFAINTEASLSNESSVLTHNFTVMLNYNLAEKLILFGIKFNFFVTNSVGFDVRIVSPIQAGGNVLPTYRSDTYFVFSPMIRINY